MNKFKLNSIIIKQNNGEDNALLGFKSKEYDPSPFLVAGARFGDGLEESKIFYIGIPFKDITNYQVGKYYSLSFNLQDDTKPVSPPLKVINP